MGTISCAGCGIYVSTPVRLTHNRPAAPLRARSQTRSCDLVVSTAKLNAAGQIGMKIIRDPRARPRTDPAASALKRSPTLVSSDASGCVPCVPVRSAIGGLGPYLINFFALYYCMNFFALYGFLIGLSTARRD